MRQRHLSNSTILSRARDKLNYQIEKIFYEKVEGWRIKQTRIDEESWKIYKIEKLH